MPTHLFYAPHLKSIDLKDNMLAELEETNFEELQKGSNAQDSKFFK